MLFTKIFRNNDFYLFYLKSINVAKHLKMMRQNNKIQKFLIHF